MKAAYLANIRFPSERAHSAQIEEMCTAFAEAALIVDLFVSKRKQDEMSPNRYFDFKVQKLPYGFFSNKYKSAFYLSELIFTLAFLFKGNVSKYNYFISRSETILYILSWFINAKKLLWEVHDLRTNFFAETLLKLNTKLVVTSGGLYEYYQSKNYQNVLLAYNGVSEDYFSALPSKSEVRRSFSISEKEFVVMYIGGFDKWKGVEVFLEASNLFKDARFVAIGGNDTEIATYSLKYPDTTFLGRKPYKELSCNQQLADILVVPNTAKNELSEKFTSPLKLFAHMTSGIPIIASEVLSIKNIVNEPYITFFTPDKPQALAVGILDIKLNYSVKRVASEHLREISKEYTWSNRARKIITFLTT